MKLLTAVASICLLSKRAIAQADTGPPATISSLDSLPYDENNRLSTHVLAYPSHCADKLDDPRIPDGLFHHRKISVEGDALRAIFGHIPNDDNRCMAACLEKGTEESVVARPLPHRYWIDGYVDQDGDGKRMEEMTLLDFVYSDGCGKVEWGMVNYHDRVSKKPAIATREFCCMLCNAVLL